MLDKLWENSHRQQINCENLKNIIKLKIFRKENFSTEFLSGYVKRSYDNTAKKFGEWKRNIQTMFLWTRIKQFGETCREIFCRKFELFLRKLQKCPLKINWVAPLYSASWDEQCPKKQFFLVFLEWTIRT